MIYARGVKDLLCNPRYQHWTAVPRMVINNGPDATLNSTNELVFGCGHCQFCPAGMRSQCAPEPYTGDSSTNQRYYLEDAPEFLSPGSGTFFSDAARILYDPLHNRSVAHPFLLAAFHSNFIGEQ